jgi:hypothetical protein
MLGSWKGEQFGMKTLFAMGFGFMAGWLFGSERARAEAQRRLAAAPQFTQQARQTVAAAASTGAERVSGLIDSSPLPPQVKDTASRVTSRVRATGEGQAPGGEPEPSYIGTPGVESAAGRDRTKDGDLPPDMATP